VTREVPSFSTTISHLFVSFICHEIFYYYIHRLLHHKNFYKHHKRHHEFKTPICFTSMYCSVLEYINADMLAVLVGYFFTKSHMSTVLLWQTLAMITTLSDHSGYHLPFLHSSELHDYHHLKFNLNYSVYGILDYVHGTFGHFELSENKKRHKILLSFAPGK
jgi:fatty acid hydroxylase domain-containing protein 2